MIDFIEQISKIHGKIAAELHTIEITPEEDRFWEKEKGGYDPDADPPEEMTQYEDDLLSDRSRD
ncbi:MAG: hypothetical protein WC389_20145 [Lutibacter sp.]|jgi:hypothetical protein